MRVTVGHPLLFAFSLQSFGKKAQSIGSRNIDKRVHNRPVSNNPGSENRMLECIDDDNQQEQYHQELSLPDA